MKTMVITGGTSGIGLAAARALASHGARMILVGRDKQRGEQAIASLAKVPGHQHRLMLADLSLMAEVRRLADDLTSSEAAINVLANNAGTWFHRRETTSEGWERTVAVNHLAYVALTLWLESALSRAPRARVINTGSFVFRHARYDPNDMQAEKHFSTNGTYATTKLYNLMFTRALARRWADRAITVNCFSPGFVATRFGRGEGGLLEPYYRFIRLFAASPDRGARTLVHLAQSPEVAGVTGAYFENLRTRPVRGVADDEQAADALLSRSEEAIHKF